MCIADSLCYKPETNTPLQSNYNPIKMFLKKSITVTETTFIFPVLAMI